MQAFPSRRLLLPLSSCGVTCVYAITSRGLKVEDFLTPAELKTGISCLNHEYTFSPVLVIVHEALITPNTKQFERPRSLPSMPVTTSSIIRTDVLSGHEASSMPLHEHYLADSLVCQQQEVEKPAVPEKSRNDQPSHQIEAKKVMIPDLFASFVSQRPQPNPYYEAMKKESEEWMKQYETKHFLPRQPIACIDDS